MIVPFDGPPERLLLTPHVGYVTRETYQVFYPQTVEAVTALGLMTEEEFERAVVPLEMTTPR